MRPALFTLMLGVLTAFTLRAQEPASTLRFVTPPPGGAYVTGLVQLKVAYTGEGGGSAIEDVTFFADGRQICVAPGARMECEWDAGPNVDQHALRAVARLRAGGRVIANVRTQSLAFAETAKVNIVQVNAVITDGGRFVKGLTREAFRLLDDKQERPIIGFDPNGAPLELVLALDVSASMEGALADVRAAARTFLKALGPRDRVTLVAFNDSVFTLAGPEVDSQTRIQALEKLSAWGRTALYDVIVRSVGLLSRQPGRRVVVVFTDGEDVASNATFEDVTRVVSESDTTLFAVGLGREARLQSFKPKLEALADASGGLALFAENSDKLSQPFAEVIKDLSNQYTLGFEPRHDGKPHSLTLLVPGRHVRVRARRGYTAPSN